jgi:hypothetical protein
LHRIRATLRSALNAAIRDGQLRDNPARFIELPTPRRPLPQVWTDHRVEAWQRGGVRPSVAVWTARQLATFLDGVAEDRMFAMWWLIALRGRAAARRLGCAGQTSTCSSVSSWSISSASRSAAR